MVGLEQEVTIKIFKNETNCMGQQMQECVGIYMVSCHTEWKSLV